MTYALYIIPDDVGRPFAGAAGLRPAYDTARRQVLPRGGEHCM